MGEPLHIQLALNAAPGPVFRALTEGQDLTRWFAEHADVALSERRYDFWGRFTPGCPDRETGRHAVLDMEPDRRLGWSWNVQAADCGVVMTLLPRDNATLLIVRHAIRDTSHDIALPNFEDFWCLSLENLRRHLDGRTDTVWCDFCAMGTGDITHSVEIAGSQSEVFGALIRPDQLERWIASQAVVEPVAGGRYQFGWRSGGPVKILDLVPDERLVTTWPEQTETVVTWTLQGSGGRTRLTIVHSGFAPDEPTGGLNAGWLNFMSWIKSMVEVGPAWRPPLLAIGPSARSFYARSIGDAQAEIVVPD